MPKNEEIDDSLYSRQRYVLGDEAMKKMAKSNVFLSGMGGVGVEIAKNVALAGIRTLTLHDTKETTILDLSSQFYLNSSDLGKNRVHSTASKISELNPYVKVNISTVSLDEVELSYFDEFKCVIITDARLDTLLRINEYCHSKNICFISAEVRGIFAWSFVDFGKKFEVLDSNGEQIKNILISNISKANPGVVSCIEHHFHDLQTGDYVEFSEVKGCSELNQGRYQVTSLTPSTFSIDCDTSSMSDFIPGSGIASDVKVPVYLDFLSLQESLKEPGEIMVCDYGKFSHPNQIFLAVKALYQFEKDHKQLPDAWSLPHANLLLEITKSFNHEPSIDLDEKLVKSLAFTAKGTLAPLSAFLGGVVGQEALKAISGKFTPIKQWMFLDAIEVLPKGFSDPNFDSSVCNAKQDRLDGLRMCVGEEAIEKIASTKLFMVGSGAIGCELIKNFALLSVGDKRYGGSIVLTDNDLIEKSNLNRQFLFRPEDISQPKSTTAAKAALKMNEHLNVIAHLDKVCPQAEEKFSSEFYQSLDVIVNALDNVEARLYMDTRAVAYQRPLLESGTLGTKGHVQVIVPFLTESYSSSKDPQSKDVPYCTLKFFPGNMEHCIVWAREMAFEDFFVANASNVRRYFEEEDLIVKLKEENQELMRILPSVANMIKDHPSSFADCVSFARLHFENFFKNNILQLLKKFPLNHTLNDGSLFWASPKRPPTPIDFDPNDPSHFAFVYKFALLWATVWQIGDITHDADQIKSFISSTPLPSFIPKDDVEIETDENAKKKDKEEKFSDDIMKHYLHHTIEFFLHHNKSDLKINPIEFEKDDDRNHHIDFITAAANLRARCYSIKEVDRLEVKRIAGNITPAIATTTSAVSGFVSLELIKIRLNHPIESYKNSFMNLAIPIFSISEPGVADRTVVSDKVSFTLWDIWEVFGNPSFTLQNLFDYFKEKYQLNVTGVFQGSAMVWIPGLPMLMRKLPKPVIEIFQNPEKKPFITIGLTFSNHLGEPVKTAPPIRYFFEQPLLKKRKPKHPRGGDYANEKKKKDSKSSKNDHHNNNDDKLLRKKRDEPSDDSKHKKTKSDKEKPRKKKEEKGKVKKEKSHKDDIEKPKKKKDKNTSDKSKSKNKE